VPAPELQRRPEVAAIRDLELAARALVAGLRHGRHTSPLLGAGPEIWGVRPYRQGDDAAQVDWRRSARGDRLYSRERVDTSQTQALVVVDASRSMAVGHAAGMPTKIEVARIVAAAFVTLLIEQGDTVGLYASSGAAAIWGPPAGGAHHGHVLLEALYGLEATGAVTPSELIALAVARLRRPSLLVVLSDGWDGAAYVEALRRAAASGHDVAALHLTAAGDRRLPAAGIVELEDAESGDVVTVDTQAMQASYVAAAEAHATTLDRELRGPRLIGAALATDTPLVPQLRRFLTARAEWS
jgi:uncharacterized protein (DUF58 family)